MFKIHHHLVRSIVCVALFASVFGAVSIYAGIAYTKYCDVWYGRGGQSCQNNFDNVEDYWARYSSHMTEWTYVPDYWHIRFDSVRMQPYVVRGDPVYGVYWITDNTNGKTYPTYDYVGKYLESYPNGFSFSTFSRSVNYNPNARPTSVFETFSAPQGTINRELFTHQNLYTIRY
jgi:hypothetical protein